MADRFQIEPYGSRNYALYDNGELVCVTVYKRGAAEVKRRLETQIQHTTLNALAGFNPMCIDMQEAARLTQEGVRKALEAAGLISKAAQAASKATSV